jgi:hypothetical protein
VQTPLHWSPVHHVGAADRAACNGCHVEIGNGTICQLRAIETAQLGIAQVYLCDCARVRDADIPCSRACIVVCQRGSRIIGERLGNAVAPGDGYARCVDGQTVDRDCLRASRRRHERKFRSHDSQSSYQKWIWHLISQSCAAMSTMTTSPLA